MSDSPPHAGAEWWQASDGKWYPPDLTPGPVALPPPPVSDGFAPLVVEQPQVRYIAVQDAPLRSTNGLAIASLVLGIVWVYWVGSILALIFGYVALRQIRQRNQAGRGMAKAGVILGWIGVGFLVIVIVVALVSSQSNSDASTPTSASAPDSTAPTYDQAQSTDTTPPTISVDTTPPPAPVVQPIIPTTTTTLACPSGSVQANATISPGNNTIGPLTEDVTGSVTNNTTSPVQVIGATAQITNWDGSGDTVPELLSTPNSAIVTLNPGQTTPVSDGGVGLLLPSTGQSTVGAVTPTWLWPTDSPYLSCPQGSS